MNKVIHTLQDSGLSGRSPLCSSVQVPPRSPHPTASHSISLTARCHFFPAPLFINDLANKSPIPSTHLFDTSSSPSFLPAGRFPILNNRYPLNNKPKPRSCQLSLQKSPPSRVGTLARRRPRLRPPHREPRPDRPLRTAALLLIDPAAGVMPGHARSALARPCLPAKQLENGGSRCFHLAPMGPIPMFHPLKKRRLFVLRTLPHWTI